MSTRYFCPACRKELVMGWRPVASPWYHCPCGIRLPHTFGSFTHTWLMAGVRWGAILGLLLTLLSAAANTVGARVPLGPAMFCLLVGWMVGAFLFACIGTMVYPLIKLGRR